jgi:hypothetical protein
MRELRAHPAVRNYMLFCLASLLLLVVCLSERRLGWWCLIPSMIGALTLLMQWGLGPPLVLGTLTGLLSLARMRNPQGNPYNVRTPVPTLMDILLCLAVMAYVLGHYRLLSLMRHVFPPVPRRRDEAVDPARRRSADLVSAVEMTLLGFAVPAWTGLSLFIWTWMMEDVDPPLNISREAWRILRLIWVFVFVLTATAVVVGYRRMTAATPEESLLYLQDEVWRRTRREQSNLNRWLMWARLRVRRKKEIS